MKPSNSFLRSISINDSTTVQRTLSESDQEQIIELLSQHDENGRTALHIATTQEDNTICKLLIDAGAMINIQDFSLNTPLFVAVASCRFEAVKLLVENHAIVEAENNIGETPVHIAAASKDLQILEFICKQGVDVNHLTSDKMSPLNYAVGALWVEGAKMLLEFGARFVIMGRKCMNVIVQIMKIIDKNNLFNTENAINLVKWLVENGADITQTFKIKNKETSALQLTMKRDRLSLFKVLLDAKVPIDQKLPNGRLPLQYAIENHLSQFVPIIAEQNADILFVNERGQSYLHIAAEAGDVEIFDFFMEKYKGIGPDYAQAAKGVQEYIARKREEMKKENKLYDKNGKERPIVLEKISKRYPTPRSVDPFFVDKEGNTPLMLAAKSGAVEIVERLIKFGCDPSYENHRRYSAYTIATPEIAEKIINMVEDDEIQELFDLIRLVEPYHAKFDPKKEEELKPKDEKDKRKKRVELSLTSKTALLEEKKGKSPMKSPVARPWGGSIEADEYRRKVRIQLRELRNEMVDKVKKLREEIEQYANDFSIEL